MTNSSFNGLLSKTNFLAIRNSLLLLSALLALPVGAAGVQGGSVILIRSRTAESLESLRFLLSVSYDVGDLTNGAASVARFESPQGEVFVVQGGAGRDTTYSFGGNFPRSSLSAVGGTWKITLEGGTQAYENIRIPVPALVPTDFPDYRPFPIFAYQGDPQKVFLPWVIGTSQGASISGISTSKYDFTTLGSVYTAPNGGPYTAKTSDYLNLPAIVITDVAEQALYSVANPQARSETLARFHVGLALPFASNCGITADQAEFTATGLVAGDSYVLRGSSDCVTWEFLQSFIAVSNAHSYNEPRRDGNRFFQLVKPE